MSIFNTTGNGNNFFGSYAGSSNTTGRFNNIIGQMAGDFNTTGSNNTYIGHRAGHDNIAGSYNVFLGSDAGYRETTSNKLYIANSWTSTPLIYGEFDNEYLEVNGELNVNGDIQAISFVGDGSQLTGIPIPSETDPSVNSLGKTTLSCSSGQIAKWNGSVWICSDDIDTDTDTVLSETEVDAYVANNGYLTTDTTLTETEVDAYVANNGYLTTDTTLTETEVDAYVANNGYLVDDGVAVTVENSLGIGTGTTPPQSALQVVGYVQLDLTTETPPSEDCDASSEYGRMKVDASSELLYICVVSGWIHIAKAEPPPQTCSDYNGDEATCIANNCRWNKKKQTCN